MVHVIFDPDAVDWLAFYTQTGGGYGYFVGRPYQRGAGLGTVFSSLFRFLLPVFKAAGRELGKEGLAAGSRILGNVAEGKNLRSAVVDETATGLRNLVGRADLNEGVRGIIDQAQRRLQGGRGRRRGAITRRGTRQKRAIIAKRQATDRLPRGLLSL